MILSVASDTHLTARAWLKSPISLSFELFTPQTAKVRKGGPRVLKLKLDDSEMFIVWTVGKATWWEISSTPGLLTGAQSGCITGVVILFEVKVEVMTISKKKKKKLDSLWKFELNNHFIKKSKNIMEIKDDSVMIMFDSSEGNGKKSCWVILMNVWDVDMWQHSVPLLEYWLNRRFFSLLALKLAEINGTVRVIARETVIYIMLKQKDWRKACEKWPSWVMLITSN